MATTIGLKANQSHFPILSLPQEILSSILDLVINAEGYPCDKFKHRLQTTVWLSETCKQFRETLAPKLYSEFHLVPNVVDEHNQVVLMDMNDKGRTSTSRLHTTLTNNPQLGTHCKTIEVWFDQTKTLCVPLKEFVLSEATFDFISLLGNTTYLSIDGFQPRPCDTHSDSVFKFVCTALKRLPKLKTLRLLGQDVSLPFIVDVMCYITRYSTNLSVLEFGKIGTKGSSSCLQALEELEGTGPITSLTMDEFSHIPEALEAIVRWPRNLEKLSIFPNTVSDSYYITRPLFTGWNFATVQPILETQMASLRELAILTLYRGLDPMVGDIENLDLTGFAKLEVLTLPSFQTGYDTRHIPRILAPNLRIFNWLVAFYNCTAQWEVPEEWVIPEEGMSPEEWGIPQDWVSPEASFGDLSRKQEDWVRAMVDFAAKKQQRLREIYIAFKHEERGRGDDESCLVHPCERLEKIARDSEEFGIKIRY